MNPSAFVLYLILGTFGGVVVFSLIAWIGR